LLQIPDNDLQLERGWHKEVNSWLNHWTIKQEATLHNIDTIKITISYKFKGKLWCNEEIENKRKVIYYKEIINPNLEYQKYLSSIASLREKIIISKIRMNSH